MNRDRRLPIPILALVLALLGTGILRADDDAPCGPCIERTRSIVESLRTRGWLGLGFHLHDREKGLGVQFVDPEGPTARSGIAPGDRVTKFQGVEVGSISRDEVRELLQGIHPNDRVVLEVDGEDGKRSVTLHAAPMPARAIANAVGAYYIEELNRNRPGPAHP